MSSSNPQIAHNPVSSCPHLADIGRTPFHNLRDSIRVRLLARASIHLGDDARCGACGRPSLQLYACVSCLALACRTHAADHAKTTAHHVAVDVNRAELFCCACGDQVYDRDFDAAVVDVAVENTQISPLENPRKRRRVNNKTWTPDLQGRMPLIQPGGDSGDVSAPALPSGLRGLSNLGNTCFMNSVLQALLHTPPLMNYFLSDGHSRLYCERENRTIVTRKRDANKEKNSQDPKLCLACDLDAIFSAVFSEVQMPYSPAKFLYSWWQHAANLATYEQQDAHEFFISILDGIHLKLQKDKRKQHSQDSRDCCIAHRVFSGILRSDVMCTSCGFTSTTYDPCVDISLDLEPNTITSTKPSTKSSDSITTDSSSIPTLTGCLDRFTRPEQLGSDQKVFCQQCQVRQESLKQLSIHKLPLVSCFHIKRFEHSLVHKVSRKIDQYLQFPFSLDMSPYLSSSILRSRYGNRIFQFNGDDEQDARLSKFELFAVITHSGELDAGHYVSYLRLSNVWYKCDDGWIIQVNEDTVRAAQGYMMFYIQKTENH